MAPKFRGHKSPPLGPNLGHLNTAHTLALCFF
jgi:hypothetical protein